MKKLVVVLFSLFAALYAVIGSAQTAINQSGISSFPYVINKSGSYYLTSNITVTSQSASGIEINASNVTLNLNGFTISGPMVCSAATCSPSYYTYAVQTLSSVNNATIQNGFITGFAEGIFVYTGTVSDVTITNTGGGIDAISAIIRHNVVNNVYGWAIDDSEGTISDNVVYNCAYGVAGINASITNNSVYDCQQYGLVVEGGIASGNSSTNNGMDLLLENNGVTNKNNACTSGAC